MPEIRGLTVSVGYADLLRITLPRNLRHMTECWVVTSPDDTETQALVNETPGTRIVVTDVFTRYGAMFNKGWGIETCFDAMGRDGWILVVDADIVLPDALPLANLDPRTLYGAKRRILDDPAQWRDGLNWTALPQSRDGGPIGFFQLFHADAIRDKRPWYDPTFAHAGGGDAYFMTHFDPGHRRVLPMDVLHLGPKDTHWFGTTPEAQQIMDAFVVRNGWTRSHPRVDPSVVDRVGEITERVSVPGYESTYELPFVKRAQQRKTR